jgi:tRNA modification GTPase
MPCSTDTIAALATPAGTAALAVLRVSGSDTARIAGEIFGRAPSPRVVRHADYRDRSGHLIDDTVATFFQGPRSYTGEDALEISCHGNPFIAQRILEDLFARGCRPAGPGEFTQRAFLNGRMDLSQAEAVMDVIHARSERALAAANQQLRGSLGTRMNELINRLLRVLSRIEAYIDFPDEDLPPEDRGPVTEEIRQLLAATKQLLATSHYGELLRDGIKTVIVGEPNVGKSSLLNRLVGRDRALVSPEPGTTRDFIEERVMVGGHSLRLIDTAGLNDSPAPLERLGIDKTRECVEEADLLLIVLDATRMNLLLPEPLKSVLQTKKHLIALNKSDLTNDASLHCPPSEASETVAVSALTGFGIERLTAAISARADAFQSDIGGDAVAVNARHSLALSEAGDALNFALNKLIEGGPIELIASDLRTALSALGEIVGRIDNERMLDELFANFCIGK